MSPQLQLAAFANSVYIRIKNRAYDDLTSTDGQAFIALVTDFANGFIDELETEVNIDGLPIDWKWSQVLGATLGTATAGLSSITFPATYLNLIAQENRYVQILQDGTSVSNWLVVSPNNIANMNQWYTGNKVCLTGGGVLTFSRAFTPQENNGTIVGDITTPIPRLSGTNVKAFSIIKPRELFVLGVAKNESLPDIVKGSLSPSFAQKYTNLLNNTIARNNASGMANTAQSEDYSSVGGVY